MPDIDQPASENKAKKPFFIRRLISFWRNAKKYIINPINQNTNVENKNDPKLKEFENRTINEQKRTNRIAIVYNRIAAKTYIIYLLTLIINACVFSITLYLVWEAKVSADAAVASVKNTDASIILQKKYNDSSLVIAKIQLGLQIKNDSINREERRNADYTDSIVRHNNRIHDSESLSQQRKLSQAQIDQLKETQNEFKQNHQANLDFERIIKDSVGEIVIVNKGYGLAHIISTQYTKGDDLGFYLWFLKYIYSKDYDFDNFSNNAIPIGKTKKDILIQKNIDGFEFYGEIEDILDNNDKYYFNKLNNILLAPSETRTLFKIKSLSPAQIFLSSYTITYTNQFYDTLTLKIPYSMK